MIPKTTIGLCAFVLTLVGCGDGSGGISYGAPQLRVLSGAGQQTNALRDSLGAPVGAQLYQAQQSPGLALRVVPRLHAQTSVRGIANQVVNAVGVGDNPLTAWNPSAQTDAEGIALFYFNPGTKAGESCAEIRAVVDGLPVVPDTVCVNVEAGPASTTFRFQGPLCGSPCVIPAAAATDAHGNPVPFRIVTDSTLSVQGEVAGTVAARSVTFQHRPGPDVVWSETQIRGPSGDVIGYLTYYVSNAPPAILSYVSRGPSAAP